MIETDLITHLADLNTAAGDRVFLGNAPQGMARPYVVLIRSSGSQDMTLGGVPLFAKSQFDIHVIADDYPLAMPAVNAISEELHGFRGLLGSTGGVNIQSCRCVSFPSDQSEVAGDRVTRWVQSSYLFVYSED